VFAWDSSVHDHPNLNRPDGKTQVYLILRVTLRLALPVEREIILRKRIHVQIQPQRRGLMQSLKKNLRLRLVEKKVIVKIALAGKKYKFIPSRKCEIFYARPFFCSESWWFI